jgi:serine/threonine protein kinase
MAQASPVDTLGAFAITRVVGEGGTSIVYAAQRDGEAIALKVLRDDIKLTDDERRRFLREAERLARVSHPGVIRVIEAGVLPDGRPYLALPLLDGETLAARIARAPLPHATALAYFFAAADAVEALHAAGLLHRDLKPENFFVTRDDRIVLLDFGIAREPDATASTTTQQGHIRGTPAYMAPERFFGVPARGRVAVAADGGSRCAARAGAGGADSGGDARGVARCARDARRGAARVGRGARHRAAR